MGNIVNKQRTPRQFESGTTAFLIREVLPPGGSWKGLIRPRDDYSLANSNGEISCMKVKKCVLEHHPNLISVVERSLQPNGGPSRLDEFTLLSSPLHEITLEEDDKVSAGIPDSACYFSFFHPVDGFNKAVEKEGKGSDLSSLPELMMFGHGAFVYWDVGYNVVRVNTLQVSSSGACGHEALHMGTELEMAEKVSKVLEDWGRWFDVSIQALTEQGYDRFAWINPGEPELLPHSDEKLPLGSFAYRVCEGKKKFRFFYVPIVPNPCSSPGSARSSRTRSSAADGALWAQTAKESTQSDAPPPSPDGCSQGSSSPASAQSPSAHTELFRRLDSSGSESAASSQSGASPGRMLRGASKLSQLKALPPRRQSLRQRDPKHGPDHLTQISATTWTLDSLLDAALGPPRLEQLLRVQDDRQLRAGSSGCVLHLDVQRLLANAAHASALTSCPEDVRGLAERDGGSGKLELHASPLALVSLGMEARRKASIPLSAVSYAFCYPLRGAAAAFSSGRAPNAVGRSDVMVSWLTAGGFIYFSAEHQIVAVNVIADANTQKGHMTQNLLHFGEAVELPADALESVHTSRWSPVPSQRQMFEGFEEFAWIHAREDIGDYTFIGHGGVACRSSSWREASWKQHRVFYAVVNDEEDWKLNRRNFGPRRIPNDIVIDFPFAAGQSGGGKFAATTLQFRQHADNIRNINSILGITAEQKIAFKNEGIKAITEEWQEAYTESTMNWSSSSKPLVTAAMIEKVNYVLNEAAEDCCVTGNDGKDAQQDKGHSNWFLQDFCAQPQAISAELTQYEVAALRVYTTCCFKAINIPLREGCGDARPHPLPATTVFLYEGLKKLRITHLEDGSFKPCTLWRGLKGRVEDLFFERRGGTESACVSVSSDRDVACGYADANSPTLLRFEVSDPKDLGADISWLSVFPHEKEVIYPPLTYLSYVYKQNIRDHEGQVITVRPRFPS